MTRKVRDIAAEIENNPPAPQSERDLAPPPPVQTFKPIAIKGEPLAQTILEDRR